MNDLTNKRASDADGELAVLAQRGSVEAFEQLVYRYEDRLHAFVWQMCHHQADAADITQDTFVKAFQRLSQFDTRRDFATWLFTIARHAYIDCYRARERRVGGAAAHPVDNAVDEADPAELTAREEAKSNLWHTARRCLSQRQYEAIWLFYAMDMDVPRIAAVIGKSRVHVKVILFRARQILAQKLKPDVLSSFQAPALVSGSSKFVLGK